MYVENVQTIDWRGKPSWTRLSPSQCPTLHWRYRFLWWCQVEFRVHWLQIYNYNETLCTFWLSLILPWFWSLERVTIWKWRFIKNQRIRVNTYIPYTSNVLQGRICVLLTQNYIQMCQDFIYIYNNHPSLNLFTWNATIIPIWMNTNQFLRK